MSETIFVFNSACVCVYLSIHVWRLWMHQAGHNLEERQDASSGDKKNMTNSRDVYKQKRDKSVGKTRT